MASWALCDSAELEKAFSDIADAFREITGSSSSYTLEELASALESIYAGSSDNMNYVPFKCVAVDYDKCTWQGDMYQNYGKGWAPTGIIREFDYVFLIPEVGSTYTSDLHVRF